jgi:hypothetical protein
MPLLVSFYRQPGQVTEASKQASKQTFGIQYN